MQQTQQTEQQTQQTQQHTPMNGNIRIICYQNKYMTT